jgi:hypothetical protein
LKKTPIHNGAKLDLNNTTTTKAYRKNLNTWRMNNTLLNNQCIIKEIGEEIKNFLESNENKVSAITCGTQQWPY